MATPTRNEYLQLASDAWVAMFCEQGTAYRHAHYGVDLEDGGRAYFEYRYPKGSNQ